MSKCSLKNYFQENFPIIPHFAILSFLPPLSIADSTLFTGVKNLMQTPLWLFKFYEENLPPNPQLSHSCGLTKVLNCKDEEDVKLMLWSEILLINCLRVTFHRQ